jgi:histidinol-phosphate aminotransferase
VRVRAELLGLGYDVPLTQANFVWLPLGQATMAWAAECETHGVIVRGFAGHGARVTVSSPAENDAFLAAVREIAVPAG